MTGGWFGRLGTKMIVPQFWMLKIKTIDSGIFFMVGLDFQRRTFPKKRGTDGMMTIGRAL